MAMAVPIDNPKVNDYATSDVALVAWLRYNGVEPEMIEWRAAGNVCYWIFPPGIQLAELVDKFFGREAKPEVRRFNKIFGETKQEMFRSRPSAH